MKRRSLLIYLPSVALLIVALLLPWAGRSIFHRMNGRELALSIALWWTILAAAYHLVKWLARNAGGPSKTRGFDVLPKR